MEAENVSLGAFKLSKAQIGRLGSYTALSVDAMPDAMAKATGTMKLDAGGFYVGQNPADPKVGDVRVKFSTVQPSDVTIVAKQTGNTFVAYDMPKLNRSIDMLESRVATADELFKEAASGNTATTWILRVVGFLVMWIGLSLVFKPLSVIADVIPFLGTVIAFGTGIVAFLIAGVLSFLTIAVAWFFYRPRLSLIMLAVAVAIGVAVTKIVRSRKAAQPVAVPAPPPATTV